MAKKKQAKKKAKLSPKKKAPVNPVVRPIDFDEVDFKFENMGNDPDDFDLGEDFDDDDF